MLSQDKLLGVVLRRADCTTWKRKFKKAKQFLFTGQRRKQLWTWHRRLGHPSNFARNRFDFKCETCILAKSHKNSYPSRINKTNILFLLIHSDIWSPAHVVGMHGYLYYVVFIDDCTRMSWIYFLKHKSEVFKVFFDFYNMICTQFQAQPHMFRIDNGREYVNSDMHQFLTTMCIIHQTSCPKHPKKWRSRTKKQNFTRNDSCYHARILCPYLSLARGSCHSKLPHQPSSHKKS